MPVPSDSPLGQVALSEWSAVPVEEALASRPLLLQLKRADIRDEGRQRRVIVLVHGLNSSAKIWLPFLAEAFPLPELSDFDFVAFNYQTSLISRLNPFQRLPNVEEWALVLANAIQSTLLEQERYESFVLVGHSLGGLVCKFAVRSFVEKNAPAMTRLQSLFTYGTPHHGSDRAGYLPSLFSPDLALLRASSAPIDGLRSFWNTRISALPDTTGKVTVRERAIVSVKDYWVPPASGTGSRDEKFVLRLASSHSALIKPAGPSDPRLRWFVEQLHAMQKQSECSLVEIRNGPTLEMWAAAGGGDKGAGVKLVQKLFEMLFVLDAGSADGVTIGDKFGLYYEPAVVRDQKGRVIDRIPGPMQELVGNEVKEGVTYCTMTEFAYAPAMDHIFLAIDALKQRGVEEIDEGEAAKLTLALFGRRAIRIPRGESDAAEILEKVGHQVSDEKAGLPAREAAFDKLLAASREFLEKYPGSVLAASAAFREASAAKKLGHYEEAETLFKRFCDRYPFSISVTGARELIEEIGHRRRVRDSDNAPESQLELAEFFLSKEEADFDEAIGPAFDAYCRKPELVTRMKKATRFVLTGQYVLHEVLKMDPNVPEAMAARLSEYAADADSRRQIQAEIAADVAPDRAKLLIQLLDATSADWKDI